MDLKNILSITEARNNFFKITDEAQRGKIFTLTEHGRPKVVIMSADEFDSWKETVEVMGEFPDLKKEIKEIDRSIKTGAYKKLPSLNDIMAEHGYVLADKGKQKYDVGNKIRKKRAKRT